MIAKHCTAMDLEKALTLTNEKYGGNICFKRGPEPTGKQYRFTLTVNSSKGPGHRLGFYRPGRKQARLAAACWHVHGDFFDNLFTIAPDAIVQAGTKTITQWGGNWQDWNIGSIAYPMYYSEACECGQ